MNDIEKQQFRRYWRQFFPDEQIETMIKRFENVSQFVGLRVIEGGKQCQYMEI